MFSSRLPISAAAIIAAFLCAPGVPLHAADHRDAPSVDGASEGDITDVFAFLNPNDKTHLVLAMGVNPNAVPALIDKYRFSNEFLYQFKIDVDGDYKEDLAVQVTFHDASVGGSQVANVSIGSPNPAYTGFANQALANAPSQLSGPVNQVFGNDVKVFAGLRDDPFVLDSQYFRITSDGTQEVDRDLPSTPLGHLRGRQVRADGTSGVDSFAGFNASYIVVQIPVSYVNYANKVINVWGTVSAPVETTGAYIQFERMGQQLINTVFIPGPLKDAFNQGVPADDVARWSQFFPDALTTTDNDGTGNTIAGRAQLLTTLGVASAPNGAPLLLPANFANTNKSLIRAALLPDVLRLDLTRDPNDLAIGVTGLQNGRRPGDDVYDIAVRLLRQLADVNFPKSLGVPGSGAPRAGALDVTCLGAAASCTPAPDRRVFAVLQGTDFIKPDSALGDLSTSGNDRPFLSDFPFFAVPNPRPGDAGSQPFGGVSVAPSTPESSQ